METKKTCTKMRGGMIMTTEEKAERYDKSFERAKEQLNDAKVFDYDNEQIAHDIRTTVYNIFPELKESEDEQHRKWILDYLYDGLRKSDEQFKDHFKAAIAWLEKQGEDKPVISDDALREGIAHFGITQYQIDNWLKKYVDVEKQGEHQPAWSEEDKGVLLESISVLQSSSHWVLADKLKSLKDRVGCEANCTTTSEPVVRENKGNYGGISPNSEWSEEDEDIRNNLIALLVRLSANTRTDSTSPCYSYPKEIEWLKSLKDRYLPQSHWKPTKEQMDALFSKFPIVKGKGDKVQNILQTLYLDLKALKGE